MKPKSSVRERIVYISDWAPQTAEMLKRLVEQEKGIVKVIHLGDVVDSPSAFERTEYFYHRMPQEERSRWLHSGHWLSNLPEEEKRKILDESRKELDGFLKIMKPFIDSGRLAIVGGNIDQGSTRVPFLSKEELREYAAKRHRKVDIEKELIFSPKVRKYFHVGSEIRRKGIPYSGRKPLVVETDTTFNVLFGFDALKYLNRKNLESIIKEVERARRQGKHIVLAPHEAIDWKIHEFDPKKHGRGGELLKHSRYAIAARREKLAKQMEEWKKESKGKKPVIESPHENEAAQRNLRFVFSRIAPDEIVYGHAARPLKTFSMLPARIGEPNYGASSNYIIRTRTGFYEEPKKHRFKGMKKARRTLVTFFPDGIVGEKETSLLPKGREKRWQQVMRQRTRLGLKPR